MMDYRNLIGPIEIPERDASSLSEEEVLSITKSFYAQKATVGFENEQRVLLSTLKDEDPIVASLTTPEWARKGPAAIAYINGNADADQVELLEIEAQLISYLSLTTKKSTLDLAIEIATRYNFWAKSASILTGLRRAAQKRIYACSTCDEVRLSFLLMTSLFRVVISMAGTSYEPGSFEALRSKMASLIMMISNLSFIDELMVKLEGGADDLDIVSYIEGRFYAAIL